MQNCIINNNAGGSHGILIRGESNNPNILNNTISNGAIGIERTKVYSAPGAGAATISGNTISNCSDAGIRTYYTAPAIYNNTISGCYNGIKLATASAPDIHDNAFLQNQYSVRLDQSQPSRLKWNNFGDQSTNISLLINYLASGNNFTDYQANNFYQTYTADVVNYTSTTLMARGNYWEAATLSGPVNATVPLASPNPNAGPGGQMGKSILSEAIADNTVNLPDQFSLTQNYPNPFNPTTTLSFAVAAVATVHLAIYDSEGKLTFILVDNQNYQPGLYWVVWDGQNNLRRPAASGIYFCRMSCRTAENQSLFFTTRKLLLTR